MCWDERGSNFQWTKSLQFNSLKAHNLNPFDLTYLTYGTRTTHCHTSRHGKVKLLKIQWFQLTGDHLDLVSRCRDPPYGPTVEDIGMRDPKNSIENLHHVHRRRSCHLRWLYDVFKGISKWKVRGWFVSTRFSRDCHGCGHCDLCSVFVMHAKTIEGCINSCAIVIRWFCLVFNCFRWCQPCVFIAEQKVQSHIRSKLLWFIDVYCFVSLLRFCKCHLWTRELEN